MQFDRLDPEYTLRRGYLESRPQVIQLLADDRPNLSNARMVKKRFCEQAEGVTKSLVQRWPTGAAECPFSVVTEEEVHTFRQRVRAGRRNEADQVSRHWSRPPAEYGIRLEERTDVYGRAPVSRANLQLAIRAPRTEETDTRVVLNPRSTDSSDDGVGRVKRTVLEMNERSKRTGAGMPAPKSRKDSDGGWSKGSPSSKGNTGFKGTKANIDADADSESERPSASGTNVPGPPLDSDDDHDKQEADTTDKKEYKVDLEPDQ